MDSDTTSITAVRPANRTSGPSLNFELRLIDALAGSGTQLDTRRRHNDAASVHLQCAVLCLAAVDFDFIADLQRLAGPALPLKKVRRSHLEAPVLDHALFVLHIDVDPDVGIGPVDLRNKALELNRLIGIELGRERVMGHNRYRGEKKTGSEF